MEEQTKTPEEQLTDRVSELNRLNTDLRRVNRIFREKVSETIVEMVGQYPEFGTFAEDFCDHLGIDVPDTEVQITVRVPIGNEVYRVLDREGTDMDFDTD